MSVPARSIVLLVVPALVLTLAVALLGPPAEAVTPESYSHAAVKATNAVRRSHHRHTLRVDSCLQRAADRQAARMAAKQRMYHQDIGVALRHCHLRSVGENVAVGYSTGRGVVRNGWMKSPLHRANILRRSYRLIAVAARKGGDGRWYASQVFGRR
jgi:uncharacterized protein YkwD